MNEQMQDLLDGKRKARNRWEEKWVAFHKDNPRIWTIYQEYCRDALDIGKKRMSSQLIEGRISWYTEVETEGDPYKMNNNFTAYYARYWLETHPGHPGFFKLKPVLGGMPS